MKDEIKKIFKGEVEDDTETLKKYSHDASVFEVMPKLILFPKDTEDVKNIVKWVSKNSARQDLAEKYGPISITARCAGTDMGGGPLNESLILDFTRHMNKLIGGPLPLKNNSEWEIVVQPGMFYRDFEKITLGKGLILPCYTASKSINAMGGMFGNNSAGERTLKYGQTEAWVLESKVVFADGNEYIVKPLSRLNLDSKISQNDFEGNLYKNIFELIKNNEDEIKKAKPSVSKNASGYYLWNVYKDGVFNLNKILVGSQGTLGIVTEITFKIIPEKKHSKLVVIFMEDLAPLGRLVDEILLTKPETLETYDDKTLKLAVKFFSGFLKQRGVLGIIKLMWSFWPEFFMTLSSLWRGLPKLFILAEFSGNTEREVEEKCLALKKKIENFKLQVHITRDEIESEKYWSIRRESFALLRSHVKGMHTTPFIDDIIVRPEFLPKFLPELNAILSKYDIMYTIAGHAGDGNFHIIPLMDFKRQNVPQIIIELGGKVYDLVLRFHGSITAEHNDGIIRTPYLEKMFGFQITDLFRSVKNIFDPKNIFNPGKKVPSKKGVGTKEYLVSHIAF